MTIEPQNPAEHLVIVGVNHRTATSGLRDRLYLESFEQSKLLSRLRDSGVGEACVVSTCDRVEVIAIHPGPAEEVLTGLLAATAEIDPEELRAQSFRHQGRDALQHLFAVAASIDSQIPGEPQILGQVKESHRLAAAAGMAGARLEAVLQAAYATAKRIRSDTRVGEEPVTLCTSAIQVAQQLHGDLDRCRGLLLGLGEMSEVLAADLLAAGLDHLVVIHGTLARAEAVAHRLSCNFRPWQELDAALVEADIVVTATGSGRYTILAAQVKAALKQRRQRPVLFIDAAVPGDIDPEVESLDGAFVYSLTDLERVAQRGRLSRKATFADAWAIVEEEVESFLRQRAERSAIPAVTALRDYFQDVRREILTNAKLDAAAATRLLVNRLLHDPSQALRKAAAQPKAQPKDQPSRQALERDLRRLFPIGPEAPAGQNSPEEPEEETKA